MNATGKKLYKLGSDFDDPASEGFAFSDKASVLGRDDVYDDFLPADCQTKGLDWTLQPLSENWYPRPDDASAAETAHKIT
jgi:hypothetical protein